MHSLCWIPVFILFLWKTFKSELQEDYANQCGTNIYNCWQYHHIIPDCVNTKSSLIKCAEVERYGAINCEDVAMKKIILNTLKNYHASVDVICNNPELKQNFIDNNRCWDNARICGFEIIALTISEDTHDEKDCDLMKSRLDVCIMNVSTDCRTLVKNYTDVFYHYSTCGDV
uniref:DUF19 domain-containing protein n=1 Tax=Strigamia maritima TaxID=126957 RepID=T1ITB9_STRMM